MSIARLMIIICIHTFFWSNALIFSKIPAWPASAWRFRWLGDTANDVSACPCRLIKHGNTEISSPSPWRRRMAFASFYPLLLCRSYIKPPLVSAKEIIQLEYCLVDFLRALATLQSIADDLDTALNDDAAASSDSKVKIYLEARSGAKALLNGKIGNGSGTVTQRVYILSSLRLASCLVQLQSQALSSVHLSGTLSSKIDKQVHDLTEALAEIVEFDGLDSLTDPSPRSALTMAQYTDQKALFVQRCLLEKVLPIGKQLVLRLSDTAELDTANAYFQQYHAGNM